MPLYSYQQQKAQYPLVPLRILRLFYISLYYIHLYCATLYRIAIHGDSRSLFLVFINLVDFQCIFHFTLNTSFHRGNMLKSYPTRYPTREAGTRVIRLTVDQEAVLQEQFNRWPRAPHTADVVLLAAETGLSEADVEVSRYILNLRGKYNAKKILDEKQVNKAK